MSHLALESKTDSNRTLNITFALFKGHSMLNVFKVSEYLRYTTYACTIVPTKSDSHVIFCLQLLGI